jgi:putative flippase GtrA
VERLKKLSSFRVVRFAIVGVGNTIVNFVILNFAFFRLHQNKLASSIIATSGALIISFILNRGFVFVDKERPGKKFVLFIIVTLVGTLVVQNAIYALGTVLIHRHEYGVIALVHKLTRINMSQGFVDINLSNLIATGLTMAWNYYGYLLFVFNGKEKENEIVTET